MPPSELLVALPPGQRRAAEALIGGEQARTYCDVAARLGIHVGTLYTHLRRIRQRRPEVYRALMQRRAAQLAERHERALRRARAHTRRWFRKKARRQSDLLGLLTALDERMHRLLDTPRR